MLRAAKISFLLLGLALLAACRFRKEEEFYARNRDLIRILRAQDQKKGPEKYCVRGRDGNFFYLEDLRAAVTKWHLIGQNVAAIVRLSEDLQRAGIRLLVVPAPSKVETYPEELTGRIEAEVCPAKKFFFQSLQDSGVAYLDLRPVFFQAKATARLYPRADTHWDEAAIRLAAQRIAARIRPGAKVDSNLVFRDTVITNYYGDLALKFLPPQERMADTVRLQRVYTKSGKPFTDPDSAGILLFGDSFLMQYRSLSAHLGAHLSRDLGVPVQSFHTLQPFAAGPEMIRTLVRDFPEIRTLIWVFTSRSLMDTISSGG